MIPSPESPSTGRRMTHAEAVLLCRYAKAACPQQQFDEYTPDAWSDLLGDLRFVDCKDALKAVVQRQPFVAPAEIRDEVTRIRNKRLSDFGPLPEPEHLDHASPTFNRDYHRYIAVTMRAVADGTLTRSPEPEPEAIDRPECEACPFAAGVCGCRWGGKDAETAPVSDCSGSVGTGTGNGLIGAQIGAEGIEGNA